MKRQKDQESSAIDIKDHESHEIKEETHTKEEKIHPGQH